MSKQTPEWNNLKNKYPELYEAIVAHSIWYDCGVGEGHIMDDRALPLGWLASYFDIVKSQTRNDLLREIIEEMPKRKKVSETGDYNPDDGFNDCHDQVNTLLERKLSTVKKK